MRQRVVHFLKRMDDEVDGGAQGPGDRHLAHQPLVGAIPVGRAIGELVLIDDNQQVVVRLITFLGVRLVDPAAARIAAEKNDLEDAPGLALAGGELGRVTEFLKYNLDDALELALLGRRQMIEIGAHRQ
jgi:hypothetical protein